MCIIVCKPKEVNFPPKKTLKTCFENNPDGAGFMYAKDGKVYIKKGLMTFSKFWKSLQSTRKQFGDNLDYVLHFRISTQAGTRADCTHPFPLSKSMADLRKLESTADIGIAHNGIITLTSGGYGNWYSYTKQITYNDTMEFIADYLSLIIKDKTFYKDEDTLELITKLCDSRLAILDGDGHITYIGKGWLIDNDIIYSNDSYEPKKIVIKTTATKTNKDKETYLTDEYDDDTKEFYSGEDFYCSYYKGDEQFYDCPHCTYYFDCWGGSGTAYKDNDYIYDYKPETCPLFTEGDDSFCDECVNKHYCYGDIY